MPGGACGPKYARNVFLGVAAGIVICGAVIVIRFLVNDTFVTADDVARRFGIQPLASIPEADLGAFNKRLKQKK